jgi:hypothetical protein
MEDIDAVKCIEGNQEGVDDRDAKRVGFVIKRTR